MAAPDPKSAAGASPEGLHVAIVMDEFGAVEGLVTVTDRLEGLVGALPADATLSYRALASMRKAPIRLEFKGIPPW